jgi:hypothetical protein
VCVYTVSAAQRGYLANLLVLLSIFRGQPHIVYEQFPAPALDEFLYSYDFLHRPALD